MYIMDSGAYREMFPAQIGTLYHTLTTPLIHAALDSESLQLGAVLSAHDDSWTSELIQTANDDMRAA